MQQKNQVNEPKKQIANSIYDPLTQKTYYIEKGNICVRENIKNRITYYQLPQHYQKENRYKQKVLKFKKQINNTNSIIFNPSGKSLTCKSDKIQQIDLNITFNKGITFWKLSCSPNCLCLFVGIKNSQKKKQLSMEFNIQFTTNITFKLDLDEKRLQAWIDKPLNIVKKVVHINTDIGQWTPFVRVKGVGVSLFLSQFLSDPENNISIYNIFNTRNNNFDNTLTLKQKLKQPSKLQNYTMKMIDINTILLHSKHEIKLIRRTTNQKQFNFNFNLYSLENGTITIKFQQNQIQILGIVGFNVGESKGYYCEKKIDQWVIWMNSAFTMLDTHILKDQTSKAIYFRAYEILLSKLQSLKPYISITLKSSPVFESDIQQNWGYNQSILPSPTPIFTIPQSIKLNNLPPLKFQKQLRQILWTEHYLVICLVQLQKLIIINRQNALYKVSQLNIKRGFKKQYQLNQYQKQLDLFQSTNSNNNQPSIYKILKNCLKYADKIKINAKDTKIGKDNKFERKQKDKGREREKDKKAKKGGDEVQSNATLVKILITMGFSQIQSKKAMVLTKNNIDKAIELILAKKNNLQTTNFNYIPTTWSCQQCTFTNTDNNAQVCQMCSLPRTTPNNDQTKKILQKIDQDKGSDIEETIQEDIQSMNIEEEIKKIFVWQLGFAYCPLIIVGVFQSKLRFRLFGPNPKYYSLFYNKDDQFVDLTHLTIYDDPCKIDQKPIRYQFYHTMSKNQQKQSAFGWISIQDEDIEINGLTIQNITFNQIETSKDRIIFRIKISGKKNNKQCIQYYKGIIGIEKIYVEKRKSLVIERYQNNDSQQVKTMQQQTARNSQQIQERIKINSNIIPKNGYLQVLLSRTEGKRQTLAITQEKAQVNDKIHQLKYFLPIIASFQQGSSQVATLSSTLKSGNKPLILKSLNNNLMLIEYVVLEKVGNNPTTSKYRGFIYFSDDLKKITVNNIMFELEKGKKKFYIDTKKHQPSTFVTIQLLPNEQENESELIEQIALVGLIGQECHKKMKKSNPKFYDINKQMNVVVKQGQENIDSKRYKIETEIINSIYDLGALSDEQIHSAVNKFWKQGEVMDLRATIYGLMDSDLYLEAFNLKGWNTVKTVSHWSKQNKHCIDEQTYRELLQKFLQGGDFSLIDILIQQQNKTYLKFLQQQKYNIQIFIKKCVIDRPLDRGSKKKLALFFDQIQPYITNIYRNGNFAYLQILDQAFKTEAINSQSLELVFEIVRQFQFKIQLVVTDLVKNISDVREKIGKKMLGREITNEDILGSSYGNKCYKDNGNTLYPIQHCRYIVQVGKLYRKYTIQLVNLYKIYRISLNFEKSQKKTGFKLILKSFDDKGNSKIQYNRHYPQFVWQQLSICPYSQQFERTIKQSKRLSTFNCLTLALNSEIISRFLQMQISFVSHPNIGSEKDIERCPQNQIIPQIYGEYQGESMYSLPIFKEIDLNSLIFVKNVGGIKKFNLKSANNIYCYEYSQGQLSKNSAQSPSGTLNNQETTSYLLACVELDELISRGGDKYSEAFISTLTTILPNLQRGLLLDRIVLFLKKVVQTNVDLSCFLLKNNFNNQHTFNSILRNSSLTSQRILHILSGQPTLTQIQNIIYYIKSRDDNIKQLMSHVLKKNLANKRIQQTIILHEKHGWIEETELVLDYLIKQNKKEMYRAIVSYGHKNCQVVGYCIKVLKERGMDQWFSDIFNEIIKPNRNINEGEIKQLLKCMIQYLCTLITKQQNYDESEINENFFILIYIVNKLNIKDKQIIYLLIILFSEIPNKQGIICKFLTLKQLKKNQYIPKLIELCLKMFGSYLGLDRKQSSQNLEQIYQILVFICRNQQNTAQWVNLINSDELTSLCQVCFGGEESYKIIDSARRFKLSTIVCFATIITKLTTSKSISIANKFKSQDKCIKNIIKWIMLNTSISIPPKQKPPLNTFSEIEQAAWNMLLFISIPMQDKVTQIFIQQFEKQELEMNKIKSAVIKKLYERRLLNMCRKYLDRIADSNNCSALIEFMYRKLMGRLIKKQQKDFEVINEGEKNDNQREIERQYVNLFEIEGQTQNKPKDWLLYKNGAKNSVYKFDYPKTLEKSRHLVLKLRQSELIILSKIIIGFQQLETAQQNNCTPLQILVEGGSKIDQLKFIGKMIQIPDNHYINYSVKVYGLNCAQIQASKLSSSLNKYPQIKYIKFTFKCPETDSITDVLHVSDANKGKYLGSSINFLSVQGYSTKLKPHSEIQDIQSFIVSISELKHKQLLRKLLCSNDNIVLFKECLVNLSRLSKLDTDCQDINKFIIRVCEVNTQIGNTVIERYLNLDGHEQSNEKILSQIILLNEQQIKPRILIFHNFITKYLKENKKIVQTMEKFVNKFNKIIFIIQKNRNINIQQIQLIFDTSSICTLINNPKISPIFYKYICTIMTLEPPFSSSQLNHPQIMKTLLEHSSSELCSSALEALVVSDKKSFSWFISNNYLQIIYNRIITNIKSTSQNIAGLKKDIETLASLCYNNTIKKIINSNKYNLQIFTLIINQKYSNILIRQNNHTLRASIANFISRSILGTENEKNIAEILKQSLNKCGIDHNQYFIGEIFLPIINSFERTTICLNPYDAEKKKILLDFCFKNGQCKQQKNTNNNKNNHIKYRLPTALMNNNSKKQLYESLKTNCKVDGGNFNLVASHGPSAYGMFNNIAKALTNSNQSLLILFKTLTECSKSSVLGIFYKQISSGLRTLPLHWNDNCLLFIAKDNEQVKFISCSRQNSKKFISMHDDTHYDDFDDQYSFQEKTLEISYDNIPFCEIYSSNMYGSSYINLNGIHGTPQSLTYTLQSAEYWLFEPIVPPTTPKQPSQKLQVNLTNQILNLYNTSFFETQFQSKSILKNLRNDKIYQFPITFSLKKLKILFEVIRCRIKQNEENKLIIRTLDFKEVSNQLLLQELIQQYQHYPILDLLCDVNNLIDIIDYTTSMKNQASSFLPKRGILQHFQQINGVTQMIKSIKKSLAVWKNKQRKQKWSQYVLQLQNYSKFPYFFGMYLKDNETIDLLFKLLSGLPDQEPDKKWDDLEIKSSQKLLKIIGQILSADRTTQFRQYAIKQNFFSIILQRLKNLTGLFKRQWKYIQQKQQQISPNKIIEDDGIKQFKKKKGTGYGNDGSTNTKWMKGNIQGDVKKQFQVIQLILSVIENFINLQGWKVPKKILQNIYQSALLPYLQDSLRAGTLLQISKNPPKFRLVFRILRIFAKNINMVEILMEINKNYQPKQIQSLQSLIKSLENTSNIFLSCLKSNKEVTTADKISEELAKQIIETSKLIQDAIEDFKQSYNEQHNESEMKNILQLPFDKKYKHLLKDLRFDYIDMKQGNKIKHHFANNFLPNYTPNQNKMIRLAQQLADISTSLPYQHTNSIFVRCDKDRVDFMQALIMGANGTPYGHGAYLYDIYFEDTYPSLPPKVNLTTTGYGKVRFNPNLYACGKVCLSLLGTWRGNASENWDPKVSTLLQVLVSIQAIIMSEDVFFNEPGFEGQQGTPEGQKKNEAYSNIVRYCNIKFAMIQNLRNPPKGFQNVIKRHFYLKQHQIMDQCKKWLLYAEKRQANYAGLVNDHNTSWCNEFKKSKNQYRDMLQKAIQELEEEFKKLQIPSIHDIISEKKVIKNKNKTKKDNCDLIKKLESQIGEEIDVEYEKKDFNGKLIDINDQMVKDRWSRYIGAMGIDAVNRQSKADILVFGLGPAALEVVKNLVLSGCRKLTIVDDTNVQWEDLSGGFFFTEGDIGKKRTESIMYKIKQLNIYVKVDTVEQKDISDEVLKTYSLVFVTQMSLKQQFKLNQKCRAFNIKFISSEFRGAYFRILNDFGDKFEVLDKNGQQPVEVIIKSITCEKNGVVTLIDGTKHSFEDGEVVLIRNVEGMYHKEDKSKSINDILHKIKVINSKSFEIGDTTIYQPYIRNGTAKNIKTPLHIKYSSMKQVYEQSSTKLPLDENLQYYDFTKQKRNKLIHYCFVTLDQFIQNSKGKLPNCWNTKAANEFLQLFRKIYDEEVSQEIQLYVKKFCFTCSGYLPPLCAFLGGFIAQEIIKAITQKYKPLDAVFYMDVEEIIPELPQQQSMITPDKYISSKDHRDRGFEIVVGKQLLHEIKNSTSFMVGSGAIGCELLKNFAMIGLGTGQKGKITLTDPDHIQNSNLNRQFLFREKHISKPKSRTAAASILLMNPQLKGHISALLQRVSQSTKNIFSNKFFDSLTFVANALDNVTARRYVDQRCIQNKIPLFESGTLGPKGHIQVIIPYLTQSYGSKNDPAEQGQIPHCTLKLFPEQTLHCIEWARDIFSKKFVLQPKSFNKLKDKNYKPQKDDIKNLNECIVMASKGPMNFENCITYAVSKFYKYFRDDIMQLLYTYPLNAKTKDGEPFWKLPKHPPTPIAHFDGKNLLHCTFVTSMAVLLAKIYKIQYPNNFRSQQKRLVLGKQAEKIKIGDFVPSDEKAKSILKQAADDKKQSKIEEEEEEKQTQMDKSDKNELELYQKFMKQSKNIQVQPQQFEKDNDQNGHIDFIYAMSNLRAINYKLQQMDWISIKLKAGRIVPALSTTTTCVAGLQTLQICKYIKKNKLEDMRNSFLNLAVPSLQMSQPGSVQKLKLSSDIEVNLWDRWEVPCNDQTTFGQVYNYLQGKYHFHPIGVLQGMSRIDTVKTAQQKKQFLKGKVLDRLDKEWNYIDIVVLFTKSQQQQKLLENIPPVRLKFET